MPSYNLYSNCTTLAVNCVLYQNSNGTSPVGAGYYFDGTTCWVTNSSGVITGTSTCPTPTPTPTVTITPTITPTVTPTVTPTSAYSLTVYARNQNSPTGTTPSVWYKVGAGSYTRLGSVNSTTCSSIGTITGIPNNTTVEVGFSLSTGFSPSCDNLCFNATSGTTTCPTYAAVYGGIDVTTCFENPIFVPITANTNVAMTAAVNVDGSYPLCPV